MFENKSVAYYTLGCRLNFAESSTLAARLEQLGFKRVKSGAPEGGADLLVVNTCAVTEQATAKCRQQIRKLIRENPRAFVLVTGCYAQIEPKELADSIGGIDLIVGSEFKGENLTALLGDLTKRAEAEVVTTRFQEIHTFHASCSADDRTRHFLKVQDGCNYFCTYCTIPMARGGSRNPRIEELVKQAEGVVAQGGKEIVLTGVNIGDFGRSTGETFFDLCRALDQVEGVERYRIGSIEPNLLTDELLQWIAGEAQRFAPHFHIPLQAGSDEVLRLMRRRYDTALFRRKIELVKTLLPDAFIGVDVMAGMRGETADLFEQSYQFLESLPVSQLHPFTYSERTGTKALEIKPVIPVRERHERTARLVELSEKKLRDFYTSQMGTTRRVLWEQPSAGRPMHGFTENYIRVEAPYEASLINQCTEVVLGHRLGESSQGLVIL
jgi:threonylcarbamoyladenosine tRNA methylthiotransferase MtaB